ncbi:MAG TPA: dihydropteroate synthase [Methanospirillum sp.]|nr:dihydropteroate synthase [Methanospirillum sp.]
MRAFSVKSIHIGRPYPVLMGVVNISPESFYPGSFVPISSVADTVERMIENGAEILDIGARSTAPGSPPISIAEEKTRIQECLTQLQGEDYIISIDTMYPEVLDMALHFDISLANDISGLANPALGEIISDAGIPAVLMASRKTPGDAKSLQETHAAINDVLSRAHDHGIEDIILDPGIGRWIPERTAADDWELCRHFHELHSYDLPILAAVSRKSFIGEITGQVPAGRLAGTLAVTSRLIEAGASVIRAHDIPETRDVITCVMKMMR